MSRFQRRGSLGENRSFKAATAVDPITSTIPLGRTTLTLAIFSGSRFFLQFRAFFLL